MRMSPWNWRASSVIALIVVSSGVYSQSAPTDQMPIPVTTAELGSILIFPERDAPATAVTLNDTHLDAEISGVISEISARVGDRVKQGDVLARLDCELHSIEVARAQAALEAGRSNYDFSERQFENARQLSAKRSISKEEYDKRETEARTLKAEQNRLQAALQAALYAARKCAIVSPINAVVIERIASVGDYVVPGTPILRLLDDVNIEISAKVQEQDLSSLRLAKHVRFVGQEQSYPVQLRTLLPLMETRLRTYEVRLSLEDAAKVSAGETGRLRWIIDQAQVPADLLVQRGTNLGIFVLDGERAHFVPLDDAKPGHPAPVKLAPTTQVIVDGRYRLHDGDSVNTH